MTVFFLAYPFLLGSNNRLGGSPLRYNTEWSGCKGIFVNRSYPGLL